jgi:hypothetical protein
VNPNDFELSIKEQIQDTTSIFVSFEANQLTYDLKNGIEMDVTVFAV